MAEGNTKEIVVKDDEQLLYEDISEGVIKNLIYVVRGKQVMLDSDLAMLYQVETKNLNKAMKRNEKRFPKDFCFQLTEDEYDLLRFQIGTSKEINIGKGGRRYMPYAFTEQGISMLSAVLRSETAINVSIGIMRAFVEMRRFLTNNSLMFEKINKIEAKQIEDGIKIRQLEDKTDKRFEEVFDYIASHEESNQRIFFDGQIYDAFSLLVDLVSRAEKKLVLVDNYVDVDTLNILAKKKKDVEVVLYTVKKTKLSKMDVENFNKQYPTLELKYTDVFHDRFLIIDDKYAYHIGASIKDAGKKCFGINRIEDAGIVEDILERLEVAFRTLS